MRWGIVLLGGVGFWSVTSWLLGTREPWDAPAYLTMAYPLSLLLAGVAGYGFADRAWRWGVAITFAQLPVMLVQGSVGPLLLVGIAFLLLLSIPAAFAAMLGAWLRRR